MGELPWIYWPTSIVVSKTLLPPWLLIVHFWANSLIASFTFLSFQRSFAFLDSYDIIWLVNFCKTTAINRAFQRYIFAYPLDVFKCALSRWKVNFFRKNGYFLSYRWNWRHLAATWRPRCTNKSCAISLPFQQKKRHQKILIFRWHMLFAMH